MASTWAIWDRTTLLAIFAILGMSTGLASVAPESLDAVTGHTAFVTVVRVEEPPADPDLATISYGLATYRDIRLFGLLSLEKPVPASQDRMVFVWSEDAPDPRGAETVPTGDFARVRDRTGATWTIYEFSYDLDGKRHYTYGTRVGGIHHADDHSVGEHGTYNYVLVYRPARLLAADDAPAGPAAGAPSGKLAAETDLLDATGRPAPSLTETLETVADIQAEQEGASKAPRLAFGTGTVPPTLVAQDPAPPLPA